MKYRLPKYEDLDILKEYVNEHYSNYERNISASVAQIYMNYKECVEKVSKNSETDGDGEDTKNTQKKRIYCISPQIMIKFNQY